MGKGGITKLTPELPTNDGVNPLQQAPVEPFGGTDDFDISDSHVVYTTKDPQLPKAWHTKQDVRFSLIVALKWES